MDSDGSPRRQLNLKKKLNAQDFWNIAFRGLTPGGWQQKPPVATDMGDVPPFDESFQTPVVADQLVPLQAPGPPAPVVIIDDLSHTGDKSVERFIITNTQQVSGVNSVIVVPRNRNRTKTILNNLGPGIVYIGHNESVGTGGYALALNSTITLDTTRAIWAIQQPAQSTTALVSTIQEYDKNTVNE